MKCSGSTLLTVGEGLRRLRARLSATTFSLTAPVGIALLVCGVLAASPGRALAADPAYPDDFPDPYVIVADGRYWAYATGSGSALQVISSTDLVTWTSADDPLAKLPRWAWSGYGLIWAPAVLERGAGFVMYYTTHDLAKGVQCISVATASKPGGPFNDNSKGPFICQTALGGSIDPQPFVAPDGALYLMWKSDNNALGQRTSLWGQRLTSNGRGLVGSPVWLLNATEAWQGGVIEGPAMHYDNGTYYLFYGANAWDSADAAIGYAICSGPLGPCVNQSVSGPWLASRERAVGPSSPAIFVDSAGTTKFAYHAWTDGILPYEAGGVRSLWINTLRFTNGQPVLE